MMNIWHKLFGKWEVEYTKQVVAEYSSIFKSLAGERNMLLVVEKNTKSNKKRAYLKDIYGNKTEIDMAYVEMVK